MKHQQSPNLGEGDGQEQKKIDDETPELQTLSQMPAMYCVSIIGATTGIA